MHAKISLALTAVAALFGMVGAPTVSAQAKKPNIVVIMTDDVGVWNISAYHHGMMGGADAQHRPHSQ
jgi:ABC-type sugar transport system substrate-binding protein